MGISEFQQKKMTPKNQNFDFSKIKSDKIDILEYIQKTGKYRIKLYNNDQCAKFQANIFIFGCAMAQ